MASLARRGPGRTLARRRACESRDWVTTKLFWTLRQRERWLSAPRACSVALGEPGNLVLAGHRTSWFRPIEALAAGDSIKLEWFDARRGRLLERNYTVTAIRVVLPEDVSLLAPTSDDALTLITCYPFGRSPHSPQRFVVRASPAGPSRSAQISSARQFPPRPSRTFLQPSIGTHSPK